MYGFVSLEICLVSKGIVTRERTGNIFEICGIQVENQVESALAIGHWNKCPHGWRLVNDVQMSLLEKKTTHKPSYRLKPASLPGAPHRDFHSETVAVWVGEGAGKWPILQSVKFKVRALCSALREDTLSSWVECPADVWTLEGGARSCQGGAAPIHHSPSGLWRSMACSFSCRQNTQPWLSKGLVWGTLQQQRWHERKTFKGFNSWTLILFVKMCR